MVGAETELQAAERLLGLRDLPGALAAFDAAERDGADSDRCAGGRWMVHMLRGDFGAAWRESDAIRARGKPDPHRFWNGEDLRGRRVIVRCLHGFGDAVQFLRYAPMLREMAAEVTYEVPPRLVETARQMTGVENVVTWGEGAPAVAPQWDVQVEVMELPYIFRTTADAVPPPTGFGRMPEEWAGAVRREIGRRDGMQVGVVWSAGEWNPERGIPLSLLGEWMWSAEGATFWNLQGGAPAEDWRQLGPSESMRDAAMCREGILPLAAFIAQLDLVITVDTLAAHLAGSLGVPCWVLLQRAADWRWMEGREDSPWYASVRLIRQERDGDWAGVIEEVERRLAQELMRDQGAVRG